MIILMLLKFPVNVEQCFQSVKNVARHHQNSVVLPSNLSLKSSQSCPTSKQTFNRCWRKIQVWWWWRWRSRLSVESQSLRFSWWWSRREKAEADRSELELRRRTELVHVCLWSSLSFTWLSLWSASSSSASSRSSSAHVAVLLPGRKQKRGFNLKGI